MELLVTLVLGAIVLTSMVRLFVGVEDAMRTQEDAAGVQENLRFALRKILGSGRQAAFFGGALARDLLVEAPTAAGNRPCSPGWAAAPANALRGIEGASASPAPLCTVSRYVPHSDVLAATFADPDDMPGPGDFAGARPEFGTGSLFVRALAGGAGVLFAGAAGRPQAVARVAGSEADGVSEYRVRTLAWSLGTFDDPSGRRPPVPTLYVCDSGAGCPARTGPQPLVEGIEQLQCDFGVDVDGDGTADRFAAAAALAEGDWPSVVSLRVGLVARGTRPERLGSAASFALPGGFRFVPADDPRTVENERLLVRRALVRSVHVRNRSRT